MNGRYWRDSVIHTFDSLIQTSRGFGNTTICALRTHRKQIIAGIGLSLLLVTLLVSAELISTYTHYAAIVDARLKDQSLFQPPGMYASPRRVSAGQRVTQENLIQELLRAGYLQGSQPGDFAVGNFTVDGSSIEIHTNGFARDESSPAVVHANFRKDEIAELREAGTGKKLNYILLPAEMLTADFNARNQTRRAISFDELPQVLLNAICAIEDRRFFSHNGVDFAAVVRAALKNLKHGNIREGGSTITQQLVKNEFLTPEKTYRRKIVEAMMAIALERRLNKRQIMTLYCDRVYLGHSGITAVYGFRQGAQVFFGKELDRLTASEAAFLAGMVKAPNRYSPYDNLDEALIRRNIVLQAMAEAGFLAGDAARIGEAEQLALLPPQKLDDSAAPYFIDYVKREIGNLKIDEEERLRLRVETSIDLGLQQAANQIIADHLSRIDKLVAKYNRDGKPQPQAAMVAMDPRSGEILAMVGGRDYRESQMNRVSDAFRQPGSVFKPIVYATALTRGISPAETFVNAPHDIEFGYKAVYRPRNFGDSYSNQPVMLREALVRSLNVVAVDAAMRAGLGNVAAMAERMGLPRPETYPSMALGAFEATPLDLARAYTTFANNGMRTDPLAVRAVKQNGFDLITGEATKSAVLGASTAYVVTDALSDVVNRGTASRIRQMGYRGPAAGKTGTSRDGWFVGYTPKLLVVVWVGFDDNSDLKLTGGEAAVPIWTDFVKRALALRPDLAAKEFPRPAGVEVLEIDPETGAIANEFCPHKQRLLMTTYLSPGVCLEHQAPLEVFDASLLEAETSATDFVESASYQVIHAPAEESSKLIEDKKPEQKFVEDKPEKKLFFPQIR
ncbi:MAG TPA: PBP1A family penicillin-binding protein [Blastocatellia bacterium]